MLDSLSTEKTLEERPVTGPQAHSEELGFNECTFTWDDPADRPANTRGGRGRRFKLKFIEKLVFERGRINLIVGPTGSGKVRVYYLTMMIKFSSSYAQTSILMALLGEMHYKPHGLGSWCRLPREHGVAYVPQESWVLNETIRVWCSECDRSGVSHECVTEQHSPRI